MEQRSEPRAQFDQPVTITTLRNGGDICGGRFVDLSPDGVLIKSNADLEVGSLLRLEVGEDVMMTEVCSCEPEQDEFNAVLLILAWLEQSELRRLMREAVVGPTPQCMPREADLMAVA
jgi:hypothetical protein